VWSWPGSEDLLGNTIGYTLNMYSPTGQKLGAYKLNPAINGNFEPFMIVALVSSDQFFGSRRLAVMDQLGSVGTYYPWGENRGGTNPQDTWSFGTYWTDSVTGLDYANNRYYFNSLGRFITPDPYNSSSKPSNPQSWNRYNYAGNDPINNNEPTGLDEGPPTLVCTIGAGVFYGRDLLRIPQFHYLFTTRRVLRALRHFCRDRCRRGGSAGMALDMDDHQSSSQPTDRGTRGPGS
jgi:RHS repeat-associated protein